MTTIQIIQGDLLKQEVEAIVNAANIHLEGGGGIDGMIHSAAGPELLEACRQYKKDHHISSIRVGEAVVTDSFHIQELTPTIRYVVHTVGPDCHNSTQNEKREELLRNAYQNTLEKAHEKGIRSIAFPAISTGIYSYPFKEAQIVALNAVEDYLEEHPDHFSEVLLVYYSKKDFNEAQEVWRERNEC